MKRYIAILLIVIMSLALCACGEATPEQTPETPAPAPTEAPAATEAPAPSEAPSTPEPVFTPSPEGEVFLTVSSITLSLVGESEDIYAGSIPVEEVSWTSEDESIITVENGVITAAGVGETTVHASFGDRTLSCTAGCLAASEEELWQLPEATLRSPKRLPYVPEDPPVEYFEDAALMGDSITYVLMQNEEKLNILGKPLFIVRGGTSLLGIENRSYNFSYQGQAMNVEDIVALCGKTKLFIMLGQNDLGYRSIEETLASYGVILDRILEKSPGVEIYIQSVVHEWAETDGSNTRNLKIDEFTPQLIAFAEENGYHYVDIQKYIVDHTGRMADPYSLDDLIHINEPGCAQWMYALLAYAHIEMMGDNE